MNTDTTVSPLHFDELALEASEARLHGAQRQRTEALVAHNLRALFDRLPMLVGFRLRNDLMVSELSAFSWPDTTPIRGLDEVLMRWLVELAERHPEAIVLMRGRTLARSLH